MEKKCELLDLLSQKRTSWAEVKQIAMTVKKQGSLAKKVEAVHKSFTSLTGTSIPDVKEKKPEVEEDLLNFCQDNFDAESPPDDFVVSIDCFHSVHNTNFNFSCTQMYCEEVKTLLGGIKESDVISFSLHRHMVYLVMGMSLAIHYDSLINMKSLKEQVTRDDPPNVLAIGILPEVHVQYITD